MKNFLLLILLLVSVPFYGQFEAAHWFFGEHAGLDFTGGAPILEYGSQIDTEEGCSSISNACGDLILYTDGITVWNVNHEVMLNGTGLFGSDSSTQSGIIVPKPNDTNIYYIFTVDEGYSNPSQYGMCYSVVDMTLDGGLGGIVSGQKNIELVEHASEKVTAVSSSDGSSIWVITLAPDTSSTTAPYQTTSSYFTTFYAFKVTTSGVETTAVISAFSLGIEGGIGYMKASPDGTRIAIANLYDQSAYLFNFNSTTGELSNPVRLSLEYPANRPYGVEFSPNSTKLYLSDKNNQLTQFDLIDNNKKTIISRDQNYRSALQLGLDGKIYQTHTIDYEVGTSEMSVIEKPNEAGTACSYRYKKISLGTGMVAHEGLPPFIQSFFIQVETLDASVEFTNRLEVVSNEEILSVDWDFGDGTTLTTYPDNSPDNTHSQALHTYSTPGTYTITAVLHLAVGCDTSVQQTLEVPPMLDPNLTAFCTDNSTATQSLDLHYYDSILNDLLAHSSDYEVHYYLSDTDAINDQNEVTGTYTTTTNADKIYYKFINYETSKTIYGVFVLNVSPNPEAPSITSYEICDTDTDGFAEFDLTIKNAEILQNYSTSLYAVTYYLTNTDAESATNAITTPQSYTNNTAFQETLWYRIENTDTGCYNTNSFDLIVHPLIDIDLEDEFILCKGYTIQVDAPAGFSTYKWSTGDTSSSIIIDEPGNYSLTVINEFGCEKSKTFEVILSDIATIENIEIQDFVPDGDNRVEVVATGIGNYEYSIDGMDYQDNPIFTNLKPGTYTVYVADKNACGIVSRTIDIFGAPAFFTPNGDGINDFWQVDNIEKKPGSVIKIYDRYGKLLTTFDAYSQGWNGSVNGQPVPADDYWFVVEIPELNNTFRTVKGHFTLKR